MRKAEVIRKTKETDIKAKLNVDGRGRSKISTGIPFFDHMLDLFTRHGLFDLELIAKGDLQVDHHHTVEDVGIVLGEALRKALGDLRGARRYGFFTVPMDEVTATVILDLSGRPSLVYKAKLSRTRTGEFDADLVEEFFKAFVNNAKISLHIVQDNKGNLHHQVEAIFKAFGRALDQAVQIDPRRQKDVPSTKGVL